MDFSSTRLSSIFTTSSTVFVISSMTALAQNSIPELINLESFLGGYSFETQISNELGRPTTLLNFPSSRYPNNSETTYEEIPLRLYGESGFGRFSTGRSRLLGPIVSYSIQTYNGAIKDATGNVSLAPANSATFDLSFARKDLDSTFGSSGKYTPAEVTFSYTSFLLLNSNAQNYTLTFYDQEDEVIKTFSLTEASDGAETNHLLRLTESEGQIVSHVVYSTTAGDSIFRPKVALDDLGLSVAPVPEPSSSLMLTLAVWGLMSRRKRT